MLRSIDFKTMPYLFAKWIESRYDDSHELRAKGKNGYIDGKADAYESSLREFKRIFNVKEE